MRQACKNCEHMEYVPKEKPYGMGFHWCDKYEDAITEVKHCEKRTRNTN